MNIMKAALRHIQAVLPKSWQRPVQIAQDPSVDRFEMVPAPKRRSRIPAIDWAEVDRRLPQGDPLQVMDQVLGSSPWYSKVQVPSIYGIESQTTASQSQASLAPPAGADVRES